MRVGELDKAMEIFHHFFFKLSGKDDRREFREAGIKLPAGIRIPGGGIGIAFDIAENDPKWAEAARLAARYKAIESVYTRFTEAECDSAKYLGIVAASHRGFPEPASGKGYLAATFDLSAFCARCGIGRRQVRPFRMKAAPRLHNSLMQLNWIFDEYFAAPAIWAGVFKPMGIGCRPVRKHATGAELDSVVQLDIAENVDLKSAGNDGAECPACGRRKTPVSLRGYFPEPESTEAPIFKSSQYFGSDAGAFRLVFVSNALYRKMKDASLRGVEFYPCNPASGTP